MRTTVALNDRLLHCAKKRAAEEGTTLSRLIEEALRSHLTARRARQAVRLHLLTRPGRIRPGVILADRDAPYERMEGRG